MQMLPERCSASWRYSLLGYHELGDPIFWLTKNTSINAAQAFAHESSQGGVLIELEVGTVASPTAVIDHPIFRHVISFYLAIRELADEVLQKI
jgi:hypothetical protein